ncbi:MATE family efflux transporter [candidate division KSB1 bacterium]|nr:MATE family efflux transporter [candidate division KSB1 bacterium]
MQTKPEMNEAILFGPLNRGIFKLAIPATISVVSIMLFEFIDLFWIGRLGAGAVAALGAASFLIWTIKALTNCVAAGVNAIVARMAGARNYGAIQQWTSQGLLLTAIFSTAITIISFFVSKWLFLQLGLEPEVAQMAQDYTLFLTIGIIFIYEFSTLDTIFRSLGNTFIPMMAIVFSLTLNALLDPLFIFGWFGFPRLGMPGGALATTISHGVGMLLLVAFLPRLRLHLNWNVQHFFKHSLEILRIGVPIGLIGAIFSVIYIVLSKNIAYFGTTAMAAISVCHRIEGIPYFISFGFSVAVATFVGQNLGNRNPARAAAAVTRSLGYASLFLLLVSVIFMIWGKVLLAFFVPDPQVIAAGYQYLFIIAIFEVFLGAEVILEGAFTGAGDTRPPFVISISLTFLRIPLAYFLSITLNLGVTAIWWVISVSTFLKGTLMFYWFNRGQWKMKQIAAAESPLSIETASPPIMAP